VFAYFSVYAISLMQNLTISAWQ